MNDLPQPLTPADCDLRGLPFMPLEVIRLLQSTTFALSTGDEFKAAFALWCASWLEVPAASLPDDDRMLEYLSKAKSWKKVREVAMRGWVTCADGRLYHPVVAKNALEAWDRRVEYREVEDNKNERQRRWRERCKHLSDRLRQIGITPPKGASLETLEELLRDAGVDIKASTNSSHVDDGDEGETSTVDKGEIGKTGTVKRQRQGQGQGQIKTLEAAEVSSEATSAASRIGEICIFLRRYGINTSPQHLSTHAWAGNPAVTDELLTTAIAKAKKQKPNGDIHPNYLKPIIEDLLHPLPEIPRAEPAWDRSDAGTDAKGRELGMTPRGGESYRDYAARIRTEIDRRKGARP